MSNFKQAKTEALEFLRTNNSVGVVSTVDGNGQPFSSPVYYVMGSEFDLFFLTSGSTHKSKNISSNDKVAFTVGTGPDYISVMIRGRAKTATGDEQYRAISMIKEKAEENSWQDWPIQKLENLDSQNLVLYKIVPESVTFLNINSKEEPKSVENHLYHLMD